MRFKPGTYVRLVLTDGVTVEGIAARSGQWGVHRLNRASLFTRLDPERVQGYLLVPKDRVMFAQITPNEGDV